MAESMNRGGAVAERRRGQESEGVLGAVKDSAQGAASGVASAASQAWESTSEGVQQAASAVAHTAEGAWGVARLHEPLPLRHVLPWRGRRRPGGAGPAATLNTLPRPGSALGNACLKWLPSAQ